MSNKHYHFSLAVGFCLLALGALLLSQVATGGGLLGVGVALIALTVFSRQRGRKKLGSAALLPVATATAG